MERDGLKSALQRTMEESKRLVREGDEQVERITKECERIARYVHVGNTTCTHVGVFAICSI